MPVKTSLHEQIGQRIANIRREAGLTQQDLAETVGVSRSAVAQWETGRAGQLIPNLTAIAQALGVGIETLTHGEEKRAPALAASGDELAMLRLYRACRAEDRQILLRTARRLARGTTKRS